MPRPRRTRAVRHADGFGAGKPPHSSRTASNTSVLRGARFSRNPASPARTPEYKRRAIGRLRDFSRDGTRTARRARASTPRLLRSAACRLVQEYPCAVCVSLIACSGARPRASDGVAGRQERAVRRYRRDLRPKIGAGPGIAPAQSQAFYRFQERRIRSPPPLPAGMACPGSAHYRGRPAAGRLPARSCGARPSGPSGAVQAQLGLVKQAFSRCQFARATRRA